MKKQLIFSFLAVFVCLCAFLIFQIRDKVVHQKVVKENVQLLPNLPIFEMDSSQSTLYQALHSPKTTLLIFFNPACEHCQYEASEISKHIADFEGRELVFISWENIKDIQAFKNQYFVAIHQVHFYKVSLPVLSATFGSLSVPSIYVYDQDKKLAKQYKGETKIELLIANE